eukprot:TRINITY_DN6427_c0_g1_i1.p1 TRINITY_DN6427_c0_g1~~TRINITY_DN6427_c0_g1_i1.p1  ORF type:complete len:364 (-),score=55.74 TRINITY_DN6427_c0_g1_i1:18-1109(-)
MGKKKESKPLPPKFENKRTRITVTNDGLENTTTHISTRTFESLGFDNSFDIEEFKRNFKINIISLDNEEMVFDLIGVDVPIANALRRILIAEVPTVAIETVYMVDNTSVINDEVLSHRLGLIPINVDPNLIEFPREGEEPNDKDTVVFKLDITCSKNPAARPDAPEDEKYINPKVTSGHLEWIPQGTQLDDIQIPVAPVHNDILIAKLRPGQSIHLEAHCKKGIGKTHAKWSPVSTASYRLLPELIINKDIVNEDAEKLVKICPTNVFDIEDLGNGSKRAYVARPRDCTVCRECIRFPDFQPFIEIYKVKDHFIFSIESSGVLPPHTLFMEAVKILIDKCVSFTQQLERTSGNQAGASGITKI